MRIGIDARYAYDHFPGIGRYIVQLVQALGEQAAGHTFVVLYNPALPNSRYDLAALRRFPALELVATTARPFAPAAQVQIPRLARHLRLDLLHSPYYIKPYFGLPCPSVVTIYDVLGHRLPHALSLQGRVLYRVALRLAVQSQAIITISQHASADLQQLYGVPTERLTVTPLAADARFRPQPPAAVAAVRANYHLSTDYALYLGSNKPHKNLARLVQAWAQVDTPTKLVVAGHTDPRHQEVQRVVAEQRLGERVLFLPNVDDADLPALYSGAVLFGFPSTYEGFGLPPLEAMACGVPVLCANSSSLPEVVGDAAITVDPYDVAAIASGLQRLLTDESLRQRLREQGLLRAQRFSWQRTAAQTLAVYRAVGAVATVSAH